MNMARVYFNVNKISNLSCLIKSSNIRSLCNAVSIQTSHLDLYRKQPNISKRFVSTIQKSVEPVRERTLIGRILNKIPFINVHKNRLGVCGYILYESIADKINYSEFFEEFSLPDTFYSWFTVTELHIWMLMVRCMAEGEDGRIVRNSIVQALWADVNLRAKKLGAMNPSGVRMQISELSEQFQASLIAYDEGLQSDDVVLAGAIWRRMYQQKDVDPEHLESLVKYMRRQIRLLDNLPSAELFSQKKISWQKR